MIDIELTFMENKIMGKKYISRHLVKSSGRAHHRRTHGASVIATSSSDDKLERTRSLGADHTINYRHHPDWGTRVREWTGSSGVDHVVEVGGPGTLPQSIAAVAIGGHIALIGVLDNWPRRRNRDRAFNGKQARLQGLIVGSRRHQIDFVRAIDAADIKPVIDRGFGLDKIADAFRYEANRKRHDLRQHNKRQQRNA